MTAIYAFCDKFGILIKTQFRPADIPGYSAQSFRHIPVP